MTTNKVAVDQAAKDYWTSYFSGGYGASWVKEIPRRIKASLSPNKTASTDAELPGEVVPAAWVATSNGGIEIEGALRGTDGSCRLFHASFDAEGNVIAARTYGG